MSRSGQPWCSAREGVGSILRRFSAICDEEPVQNVSEFMETTSPFRGWNLPLRLIRRVVLTVTSVRMEIIHRRNHSLGSAHHS